MKFYCNKTLLNRYLTITQKTVSTRNARNVLSCFYIKAFEINQEGFVTIQSYNDEQATIATFPAAVSTPGHIALNAGTLTTIVSSLLFLSDEQICIETEGLVSIISCENSIHRLNGSDGDEFPPLPEVSQSTSINIPANQLKKSIKLVNFATSSDASRQDLSGVLFQVENRQLTLSATDSKRLTASIIILEEEPNPISIVVPNSCLNHLLHIMDNEDTIKISLESNYAVFSFSKEKIEIITRLMTVQMPDYKTYIPQNFVCSTVINKNLFKNHIKLVMPTSKSFVITMIIENNRIEVKSQNSETGSASTDFETISMDGSLQTGFNSKFMLDALNVIEDEEIIIHFSGPESPAIMKLNNSDSYIYIIMPVKLFVDSGY